MILNLSVLATTATQILADSSSDDGGTNFAFIFLFAGFVFYGFVYLRYRNTDKRHNHESETEASIHNLREDDRFHRSLKGVSNSKMSDANNKQVRGASKSGLF